MKRVCIALILSFLCFGGICRAQFYTYDTDPGSVKWNQQTTEHFRIIYPRGLDSLAREYAKSLEINQRLIGASIGLYPNEKYRRPMPVILHAFNTVSNGSVAWAPRVAYLNITPDAGSINPIPWIDGLVTHESRHISQMQEGRGSRTFKALGYVSGQLIDGLVCGLYPGSAMMEGDAVVAETALSDAGRGRSAAFLDYMMMSFDTGDLRNWSRWKYGSIRHYTPDYYRFGYLTVAGMRYVYDEPLYSKMYYDRLLSPKTAPFPFAVKRKVVRSISGKNLNDTFLDIENAFLDEWRSNLDKRSPFLEGELLTKVPARHTEYNKLSGGDLGEVFAVKSGIQLKTRLVRIDGSGESFVSYFSSRTSTPRYSPAGKLFWSENVPDLRWSGKMDSDIYSLDLGTRRRERLTRGERYFNPSVSADGGRLGVSEYALDGRSSVLVLNAADGAVLNRFPTPDSLQIVGTAWIGEELYASGISKGGYGLYRCDSVFSNVLSPMKYEIRELASAGDELTFICDLNGAEELYSFSPSTGDLTRLTSTRYGTSSATFSKDGKTLNYTTLSPDGRLLYSADSSELQRREVTPDDQYHNKIAETLAEQENALLASCDTTLTDFDPVVEPYSKVAHALRFHSWLPIYYMYDNVQNLSYDISDLPSYLGATGFFQNDLSTLYGTVGYKYPYGGAINLTYAGLYPVFETQLEFGKDSFNGKVKMYVPLNFSSGGWNRGLIPTASYAFKNSTYVSLRGYSTLPVAVGEIYPRLGIGEETILAARPGLQGGCDPSAVEYIYGYVPGVMRGHGIKLTGKYLRHLSRTSPLTTNVTSMLPRGFISTEERYASRYRSALRLTAEYAMPVAPVDWHVRNFFYLSNFELHFHYDQSFLSDAPDVRKGNLSSVGGKFAAHFNSLLGIHFDSSLGISYSYNMGSLMDIINDGAPGERHHIEFSFSMDL